MPGHFLFLRFRQVLLFMLWCVEATKVDAKVDKIGADLVRL
jgi:hypothetical protein